MAVNTKIIGNWRYILVLWFWSSATLIHIGWKLQKLLYLWSSLHTLYMQQYLAPKSGTYYSKLTFLVSNKDFIAGLCEKWTNIAWTGYVYKTGGVNQTILDSSLFQTGLSFANLMCQLVKINVPHITLVYHLARRTHKIELSNYQLLTPPNVRVENNFVCKTKLAKCVKHSFCLAQAQVSS